MPIAPTAERVAFAIATTQVGQDGTVELNGATVESRRHAPDRYEVRLAVAASFLTAKIDFNQVGWTVRTALHPDDNINVGFPTAQDAIEAALRYLVVLDEAV